MDVFWFSKRVMGVVGLYQPRDELNSFNFIQIIQNIIVILCPTTLLVPSVAFLILDAKQFSEICDAIANIGGATIVLAGYIVLLSNKSKLNRTIFELEDQISERESTHATLIYKQTSDHVVRVCKRIFVVVNGSIFLFYSMPLIKVAADVLTGHYSQESWTLIFQVRMPYDISTSYGYAATLAQQICSCIVGVYYFSLVILLFIGFCNFATAHAKNIIESFEQINEIVINEGSNLKPSDRDELMKSFLNTVKHHSCAINFWKNFSEALSGVIFIHIAMGQFTMIGFLYQFQMSSESGVMFLLSTLVGFVNVFGCIFIFCYLGDGVTEHYHRIGDSLCKCKWYLFPTKIQQKLVPILIVTQRPRFVSGLSIILCTIENFTAIVYGILSYFMALRTLT